MKKRVFQSDSFHLQVEINFKFTIVVVYYKNICFKVPMNKVSKVKTALASSKYKIGIFAKSYFYGILKKLQFSSLHCKRRVKALDMPYTNGTHPNDQNL